MREGTPKRIEHDLDRRSVRQVRHVLFRQNARDDALVTVTTGHLVADRKLALHGDEDLDHLDDARRKLVALTELGDLLFVDVRENLDLALGAIFVLLDLRPTSTRADAICTFLSAFGSTPSSISRVIVPFFGIRTSRLAVRSAASLRPSRSS